MCRGGCHIQLTPGLGVEFVVGPDEQTGILEFLRQYVCLGSIPPAVDPSSEVDQGVRPRKPELRTASICIGQRQVATGLGLHRLRPVKQSEPLGHEGSLDQFLGCLHQVRNSLRRPGALLVVVGKDLDDGIRPPPETLLEPVRNASMDAKYLPAGGLCE